MIALQPEPVGFDHAGIDFGIRAAASAPVIARAVGGNTFPGARIGEMRALGTHLTVLGPKLR